MRAVVRSFGRLDRAANVRLVAGLRRLRGEDGETSASEANLAGVLVVAEVFELGVLHPARGLRDQLGMGDAVGASASPRR